jgi:predicted nucleic acid-binding protein
VITAVDTNVLLDVLGGDPRFGPASREALRSSIRQGRLIACEIVWAETSASFPSSSEAGETLRDMRVEYSPVDRATALAAGEAWRSYRRRGGHRSRVIADFLIGAHAGLQADRLLTRDRGFYRTYFEAVPLLDPAVPRS